MENVDKALAVLVERFGQSAPDLWASLVAAQRVEAAAFLLVFSLCIIASYFVGKKMAESAGDAVIGWILASVGGLVVALIFALVASSAAVRLFYPEAAAIKTVLKPAN